jgi:two-component system response regulator FixJ
MIDDNEDDIVLLRERLASLPDGPYELSSEVDAENAIARVKEIDPAVVFLDYRLSTTTGLEVIREMRRQGLLQPVIVLTGQGDEYLAAEITRAGANAYLVKDDLATTRLPETIDRVVKEAKATAPDRAERAQTLSRLDALTPREKEVLDEIVNGLTNKQIAAKMHRSIETIKVHRAHIMSKLMAESTADLVRRVTNARVGG